MKTTMFTNDRTSMRDIKSVGTEYAPMSQWSCTEGVGSLSQQDPFLAYHLRKFKIVFKGF
jgi:hypothetical protein